jgi:hypothetical protein
VGTRITYDAELSLKWPVKIADPLLRLAFNRVGDRALAGMRKMLGAQQPTKLPALSTACSPHARHGRRHHARHPGRLSRARRIAVLLIERRGRILTP